MDNLLEKLFPSEILEMELPISKQDFIKKFKEITTVRDINFFSELTEPFVYTKTKFIGNVTSVSNFEIKRYRRIFKNYVGWAVCYGNIKEDFGKISIRCKVITYRSYIKFFSLISAILLLVWVLFLSNDFKTELKVPSFSILIFLILLIPVYVLITRIHILRANKVLTKDVTSLFYSFQIKK